LYFAIKIKMPYRWFSTKFEKQIEKKIEENLHRASLMVEGDAKRLCPVRTGRLMNSIGYQTGKRNTIKKLVGKGKDAKLVKADMPPIAEYTARVGSAVHYAIYVAMGTVKMSPRSYLRPALEKNRQAIARLIGR
jgi:HK97 gp10 family phage protein